jgi:hypothetical protein
MNTLLTTTVCSGCFGSEGLRLLTGLDSSAKRKQRWWCNECQAPVGDTMEAPTATPDIAKLEEMLARRSTAKVNVFDGVKVALK